MAGGAERGRSPGWKCLRKGWSQRLSSAGQREVIGRSGAGGVPWYPHPGHAPLSRVRAHFPVFLLSFPPPLLLQLSKFSPQQNWMPRFSKSALAQVRHLKRRSASNPKASTRALCRRKILTDSGCFDFSAYLPVPETQMRYLSSTNMEYFKSFWYFPPPLLYLWKHNQAYQKQAGMSQHQHLPAVWSTITFTLADKRRKNILGWLSWKQEPACSGSGVQWQSSCRDTQVCI